METLIASSLGEALCHGELCGLFEDAYDMNGTKRLPKESKVATEYVVVAASHVSMGLSNVPLLRRSMWLPRILQWLSQLEHA